MRRFAGAVLKATTTILVMLTPGVLLAPVVRLSLAYAEWRGDKKLARGSNLNRIITGAFAPFSTVTLEVGRKVVKMRLLPSLAWFQDSLVRRLLSRSELMEITGRISEKVHLRVALPVGLSLPVGLTPGALVDVTGQVLELIFDMFFEIDS